MEKIVNKDRNTVFEIFSDFKNYQRKIPQYYPSVYVRSTRGDVSIVEEHLILGDMELLIMAKHVSQKPILHEIIVIGGDIKGSKIKQEFVELENQTKVMVDVDLKFKGKMKILVMFRNKNFKQDYDRILDDFAKLVEN